MPRRNKRNRDEVEDMLAELQREAKNNLAVVEDEENYSFSDEAELQGMRRDDLFDENSFN